MSAYRTVYTVICFFFSILVGEMKLFVAFCVFLFAPLALAVSPLPPGNYKMNYECNCCMFILPIMNIYWSLDHSINLTSLAVNLTHLSSDYGHPTPPERLTYPCNSDMIGDLFSQTWSQTNLNFTRQVAALFAANVSAYDICSPLHFDICDAVAPVTLTCSQCSNLTATANGQPGAVNPQVYAWFYQRPGYYNYANDAMQWQVTNFCGFGSPGAAADSRLSWFNNDPATCLQYFATYYNEFWTWAWGSKGTRTGCPPTVPCTP